MRQAPRSSEWTRHGQMGGQRTSFVGSSMPRTNATESPVAALIVSVRPWWNKRVCPVSYTAVTSWCKR